MNAFWTALALKATLWAAMTGLVSMVLPTSLPRWRRAVALAGIWGLWLLPWVPAARFETGMMVSLPASENVQMPWLAWVWALGGCLALCGVWREALLMAKWAREAQKTRVGDAEVLLSPEVDGPSMAGWLRPRVFLPPEAMKWPVFELRAALRHELQHVRQHDGLHRFSAAVLRSIFWWNPAVHALCSIYESESEVCCDLEAAAGEMSRRDYGRMLLAHACGGHGGALAPLFALRSSLRKRIERLVAARRDTFGMLAMRGVIVLCLLLSGGWALASIRQRPEDPPAEFTEQGEALLRLEADAFPAR